MLVAIANTIGTDNNGNRIKVASVAPVVRLTFIDIRDIMYYLDKNINLVIIAKIVFLKGITSY